MTQINSKQHEYLRRTTAKNAYAQAYLFCGPAGTGKTSALVDFICLANDVKNKDMVREGKYPDVIMVKPMIEEKEGKTRKKDILLKQIKVAMDKAQYYSYQSRFKFVVIFEAELLNSPAANSLLKFLEEPAEDTIICLLANNENRLLPTVRSRCQPIRFGLQSVEKIIDELKTKFPAKQIDDLVQCARLSHGRIEYAKKFCLDDKLVEKIKSQQEIFRKALKGGVLEGLSLSDKLHKNRNDLLAMMDEWIWFLRDFLANMIHEQQDPRVIKKVFHIYEKLADLKPIIEYENTNTKIQLDNFFVQLS